MPNPARIAKQVRLDLGRNGKDIRDQLSAAAYSNDHTLWLAADELYELAPGEKRVCISRLSKLAEDRFGDHVAVRLGDHLPLMIDQAEPDNESEADIEGLDVDGGFLWCVGSYSLKRRNPSKGKDAPAKIARLAEVGQDLNRYLLGRLPLASDGNDLLPAAEAAAVGRPAARLAINADGRSDVLIDTLRDDQHLAPFLAIPGKDNGLDIEGLAVQGNRVLIGLRGPVLRGYAMLLDIEVDQRDAATLDLRHLSDAGRRYRKHFLSLRGLGIREMCRWGQDLLVLAGPTMTLSGALSLFRLKNPWSQHGDALTDEGRELEWLLDLPRRDGCDNAEGLAKLPGRDAVLITYDTPCENRKRNASDVFADIIEIR